MKRWIWLALLLATPAYAQETVIVDSVTVAIPNFGTLRLPAVIAIPFVCPEGYTCYAPGEEPECPTCPDPPPCPECPPIPPWECPDGWECIPPPEPVDEHAFYVDTIQGSDVIAPTTLTAGEYFVRFDHPDWIALDLGYDQSAAPGVNRVVISWNGAENRENIYPYEIMPRLAAFTEGTVLLRAVVTWSDGTTSEYTKDLVVIANPSLPPDTIPGDTLAFFDIPAAVVSWGARDSTGEATIAWAPIEGTRIRYSVLVDVSIPDFYLGDDDETWWNIAGGTTTTRTVDQPPASPMAVCVKVTETAEVGRGPGGYFLANPPEDSTTVPISEIVCRQYSALTDNIYAFYASPYHAYYFQPGDTIQDGGYSVGLIKADGGPIVADSVLLLVDGAPHTLLYEPRYGATWNYNGGLLLNIGPITLSYIVFGGELPDSGDVPLVIADHNGGSVEWPESAYLSTPTNLRVEQFAADTSRHVIAWDAIPEDEQCENATGYPANCPDVYGDEVYYRLSEVEPPLNFDMTTALASTSRSFPWDYPGDGEILPDSISFCVTAEAWDCPNCMGPGGQREIPAYDSLHITRYYPISETSCVDLEVGG